MKFVRINGAIYDYYEYRLKVFNLIKAVLEEVDNEVLRYGFSKEKENIFYNKKYDLEIKILVKNRNKIEFV
ncbi:hypothetical protein KY308_00045 [Candidatus Woesearchaeota archaeon]|nr:hypothetical protein [Candidatus Woesearchaeota archaeon]